ncbi:hypothetical protein FF1_021497 [Malus domestica]
MSDYKSLLRLSFTMCILQQLPRKSYNFLLPAKSISTQYTDAKKCDISSTMRASIITFRIRIGIQTQSFNVVGSLELQPELKIPGYRFQWKKLGDGSTLQGE